MGNQYTRKILLQNTNIVMKTGAVTDFNGLLEIKDVRINLSCNSTQLIALSHALLYAKCVINACHFFHKKWFSPTILLFARRFWIKCYSFNPLIFTPMTLMGSVAYIFSFRLFDFQQCNWHYSRIILSSILLLNCFFFSRHNL